MERVTDHATKRLRERVVNSKRQVELAMKRGNNLTDYSGSFRRYLDRINIKNEKEIHLKIYGGHIYIFSKYWILITVIHIPTKYLKYKVKSKEKI